MAEGWAPEQQALKNEHNTLVLASVGTMSRPSELEVNKIDAQPDAPGVSVATCSLDGKRGPANKTFWLVFDSRLAKPVGLIALQLGVCAID